MNADVDIINYGMGNLRSVENAVLKLNFKPKISLDVGIKKFVKWYDNYYIKK